ncbi:MAG: hypothetical protein ABII96_06255 [Candidatus Zixiibacteriota bacterium]
MTKGNNINSFESETIDYELEDFEIIGNDLFAVAVPFGSQPEFKRRVLAGAASYHLQLRSIDYALKAYGSNWKFPEKPAKEQQLLKEMHCHVKEHIEEAIRKIDEIDDKPDRVGLVTAEAALVRLKSSFRVAGMLIKRGFNFEALNICRLILEQIAWAYNIHEVTDKSIFKILPTKCIRKLTSLYPKSGYLYGLLSEYVHISPYLAPTYVKFAEDRLHIILSSIEDSPSSMYILLFLADIYSVVSEYIYKDLTTNFSNLVRDANGNYRVNESRKFLRKLAHYKALQNRSKALKTKN